MSAIGHGGITQRLLQSIAMLSWPNNPETVASIANTIVTDSQIAVAQQRLTDIPSRQLFRTFLLQGSCAAGAQRALTGPLVCVSMLTDEAGVQASHVCATHPCR